MNALSRIATALVTLALLVGAWATTASAAAPSTTPKVIVAERTAGGFIVKASIVIEAPPTKVLGILTDFPSYARLNDDVETVRVLQRADATAELRFDLESVPLLPAQWYRAKYDWTVSAEATVLEFRMIAGSFKQNEGRYTLRAVERGTELTYKGKIDVDLPLAPPPMVRSGIKDAMLSWLRAVRRESNRAHAAGPAD